MITDKKEIFLKTKDKIINLYIDNKKLLLSGDNTYVNELRDKSFKHFAEIGFPTQSLEEWRNTNLSDMFTHDYELSFLPPNNETDFKKVFQCNVPHFKTELIALLNGWFVTENENLYSNADGVLIGSFAEAIKQHPLIIEKHFSHYADYTSNGMVALNTAIAQDGIFIYVPDNVSASIPIQMVNVIKHEKELFIHSRNLIIVGKNSSVTIVQCEDSYNEEASFTNAVTEVFLDKNSSVEHYKMQNLNNHSTLVNTTYFHQEEGSKLISHSITLNGGMIRNDINVKYNGKFCDAELNGIYLMDKNQHVDNHLFIDHAFSDGTSRQLYKGILDDYAKGVFNGHVLVRKDSQRTNAYQSNRNILLTDKTTINTKPFLEIYADDVKCSHGATIGQLDTEALFYLQARGISIDNARMLLLYAFAAEVIGKISIEPLKIRIDDMVKKRLRGELSVCGQCVLHCSTQEKAITFDIDISKL